MYYKMETRAVFFIIGIIASVRLSNGEENDRLARLENRLAAMETKFSKLLRAFQPLCNALEEEENAKTTITQVSPEIKSTTSGPFAVDMQKSKVVEFEERIKVLLIRSSGLVNNQVNLWVTCEFLDDVSDDVSVRWNARYENSSFIRLTDDRNTSWPLMTSKVTLTNFGALRSVLAVFGDDKQDIQLAFNLTTVAEYDLPILGLDKKSEDTFISYSPVIEVPAETLESEGFNISIQVTPSIVKSMQDYYTPLHMSMFFVNTTANPPIAEETFNVYEDGFFIKPKEGSDNEVIVGIPPEFAKFGGLITIRKSYPDLAGYLSNFDVGIAVRLINKEVGDIIAPGIIAMYKPDEKLYYHGAYLSYVCLAVGIPAPRLNIYGKMRDGTLITIRPDIEYSVNEISGAVITFVPGGREHEGTFVCEASNDNGSKTTAQTEITRYSDIVFDEKRTWVRVRKAKIVVRCKATGTPTPTLELWDDVNETKLPNIQNNRYYHKAESQGNMASLSYTIFKPFDPDMTRLSCIATQDLGRIGSRTKAFPIEIEY